MIGKRLVVKIIRMSLRKWLKLARVADPRRGLFRVVPFTSRIRSVHEDENRKLKKLLAR